MWKHCTNKAGLAPLRQSNGARMPQKDQGEQAIMSPATTQAVLIPAIVDIEIRRFRAVSSQAIVTYSIKEIFYTLQGEGTHAGRPAVFCRFSGCNLWTGREEDRSKAICQFCDTDFVGTNALWPSTYPASKYVVFTGGEPLLQLDQELIASMHAVGFEIAIETNGTIPVPAGVDWICVSPKMGSELKVLKGSELKVVIPQQNQSLAAYEQLDFTHFLLQPMDGPDAARNTKLAIELVKSNPKWKLSIQTHKLLQIP